MHTYEKIRQDAERLLDKACANGWHMCHDAGRFYFEGESLIGYLSIDCSNDDGDDDEGKAWEKAGWFVYCIDPRFLGIMETTPGKENAA